MPQPTIENSSQQTVLLIHGFAGANALWWPLAHRLKRGGYGVVLWSYPSLFQCIEHHSKKLEAYLLSRDHEDRPIHIVSHSMGCIVARDALSRLQGVHIGRVVMIAPPNRGSPVARAASIVFGRLIPPTAELSTVKTSFVNGLSELDDLEVGILAGNLDWMVPPSVTSFRRGVPHRTLHGTHNSLLFTRNVSKNVISFLRTGDFEKRPNQSKN